MSLDDLRELIRKRPFTPIRLFISDGSAYEVRHPDQVLLGSRTLVIGLALDPAAAVYERFAHVDLAHITRLEPLATPAVAGDGQ